MSLKNKRRGRPRVIRPQIDKGTKELQQKRMSIVQGQDSSLAESLLGILYAQTVISQSQFDAGQTFKEIGYRFEPCLGYVLRQNASVLARRNSGEFTEHQDEVRTKAWRSALNALKESGQRSYNMVLRVVFYDHNIFETKFSMAYDNAIDLRLGLDCLEAYFKGGSKGTRGKPCDQASSPLKATTFPHLLKTSQ